jgi:hypothetical protein
MRLLLHAHQWTDLADWGQAVHALADLSDEQIELMTKPEREAAV